MGRVLELRPFYRDNKRLIASAIAIEICRAAPWGAYFVKW